MKILSICIASALMVSTPLWATPVNVSGSNGEKTLQTILNDITVYGDSSINVNNDQVNPDELFAVSGSSGFFANLIIELAGYKNHNSFGIYDATDASKSVQLFNGGAGSGDTALLQLKSDGSVWVNFADTGVDFAANQFGFYLQTPHDRWYSESSRNTDGSDHMVAFQGNGSDTVKLPNGVKAKWTPDEYILAWEDLPDSKWDYDYNDFVVMVESVTPMPEPALLALMGTGLLVIGATMRKGRPYQG